MRTTHLQHPAAASGWRIAPLLLALALSIAYPPAMATEAYDAALTLITQRNIGSNMTTLADAVSRKTRERGQIYFNV
ncbi:hypothetical protein [Cupriavidus necator]|uniref:hypothetical protein n=1 Tax=Cupriavidus necator TaxID=106590 RepID=UPI000F51412E|nr:hypothetical protein [Cupriavidus necator]